MSSLQPTMSSCSSSNFDELQWVSNTRRTLREEFQDDSEIPVCIFNVSKTLMSTNPDSYTPQLLSLGPYHYWRLELHELHIHKVSAAKETQKKLQGIKFQNLVEHLIKLEQKIRACYHKYLNLNCDTLAWMMAVDASFLLEFMQIFALKEGKKLLRVSTRMSHLLDYSKTKSAHHNAILRDITMLENQIPLFVLRKVLEFQFPSLNSADDALYSMLTRLCKELSPFKMVEYLSPATVLEQAHLLDCLYHVVAPRIEEAIEITQEIEDYHEARKDNEASSIDSSYMIQFLTGVWNFLSNLNIGPVSFLQKLILSAPVRIILKLPWTVLSKLLGFASSKQPDAYYFDESQHDECSRNNQPLLLEEITIPSVTQLSKSGVRFLPTNGNISTINFDMKTATFYLPTIRLDVNSEVILRNLVAYEASNASGSLVFARYIELMNGIIDTKKDVKFLREKGIISNCLKSDEEVANLWNGMSKCSRLRKVPFIDKAIEDANKYYNGRLKVKVEKFMKQYVFSSWKLLTLLAAIFVLLIMSLQVFCSVYDCTRKFHTIY